MTTKISARVNGGPRSPIVCDLKPNAKLLNPKITPSWRKLSVGEEKKRKERKRKIVDNSRAFNY